MPPVRRLQNSAYHPWCLCSNWCALVQRGVLILPSELLFPVLCHRRVLLCYLSQLAVQWKEFRYKLHTCERDSGGRPLPAVNFLFLSAPSMRWQDGAAAWIVRGVQASMRQPRASLLASRCRAGSHARQKHSGCKPGDVFELERSFAAEDVR